MEKEISAKQRCHIKEENLNKGENRMAKKKSKKSSKKKRK